MMPDEKIITAFASQFNQKNRRPCPEPLTRKERMAIIQEVTDACEPGRDIRKLRKAPDAYLCMALVTAWAMQFCMRATGRVPGEKTRIVAYPVID